MNYKTTWEIVVTVPFYELAEYLTDAEYESTKGVLHKDIDIKLSFDYRPEDKEVGFMSESLEYNGEWCFNGKKTYSKVITGAIQRLLDATDVDSRWGEEAYESYSDYCDYLKYGNY